MLFENNKNEKTKEQKLASKESFLTQKAKAIKMLQTTDLYKFIDALKYAYSFSIRYKMASLRELLTDCPKDWFGNSTKHPFDKCLKCGILKPWNNTYWFDKEKAESLQQYILEHHN